MTTLTSTTRIASLPVGVYPSSIHNGLRLTVRPKAKSWVLRMRHPATGKLVQQVLGHHPDMGHVEAVQAAVTARGEIAAPKKAKVVTLQEVVNHYELTYLRMHRKNPNHRARQLHKHIAKDGDKDASALTRAEAHSILSALAGTPATQKTFKTEIQAAFNHAMVSGLIADRMNPFQLLKTKPAGVRQRVLSDGELAVLLPWLPGADIPETLKDVMLITLFTLCRSGEACSIEHSEISGDTWHLPGHKTKNGKARLVPLHPTVVAILERRKANGSLYAFPSTKKKGSIEQHVVVNLLCSYRDKLPIAHFTLHDLRRTGASQMAAMGAPENIIEVGLGHQRGQLIRTYQVYNYAKEVREWVMRLGDHLRGLT